MSPRLLVLFVVLLATCRRDGTRTPNDHRAQPSHRIAQLATGSGFACARMTRGDVRCWGDNRWAQLGDGTVQRRERPQPVAGLADAVDIAIESDTACAVRRTGAVVCWGGRTPGAERGTTRRPVVVKGMPKARAVALSLGHAHVLGESGEVWTIALQTEGVAKASGVRDVVELVAGGTDVCGRTKAGLVRCWTPTPDSCSPNAIACIAAPGRDLGLGDVVELEMQEARMCARRKDGTVWCTNREQRCAPVADDLGVAQPRKVAELAKSTELLGTACARVEGGVPWCWDDSPLRATGEDTCRASAALVAGFSKVNAISGSAQNGCFALDDEISCWAPRADVWGGEPVSVGTLQWTRIEGLDDPPASVAAPLDRLSAKLAKQSVAPGYGYVWDNAEWFAEPRGEPVGRMAAFADDERFETRHARTPVRIVKEHDEFVEIRTLGEHGDLHCETGDAGKIGDYELHAFVRKRDLVPVLAKSYSIGYADGTGVTLSSGLVVRPTKDGFTTDEVLALPLEGRRGDIGLSYARVHPQTSRPRDQGWIAEDTDVRLDGDRIASGREMSTLAVASRTDANDGTLVQLGGRCMTLRVLVPKATVRDGTGGGQGGLLGGLSQRRWSVAAGTKTYWADGRDAGKTLVRRSTPEPPIELAGRLCFKLGELDVCHDASDIIAE